MLTLPKQYAWLNRLGTLPRTITVGLAMLGTVETPGAANNPTIVGWAKEVGQDVAQVYLADSIPWCGLAAAVVAKRAGKAVVKAPLWALSWATFGTHVDKAEASLGDCLVFVRKGGGHVGWYVGEDATHYHVLGGNQADAYNISRIPKTMLYAVRRPRYTNAPVSVKPYHLASTGKVASSLA